MAQNYERRIVRGREIEFRSLSDAEFRRGNVKYQVWAILPDGRLILIGESTKRTWAFDFVRMIPATIDGREIKVVIDESNGLKRQDRGPVSDRPLGSGQRPIPGTRLKRHQGGRIDWASYGREE